MTDTDKRLLVRFEADNKGLVRKLEQSQKKIQEFESASGRSITSATNKLIRQNDRLADSAVKAGRAANDSVAGLSKFGKGAGRAGIQIQQFVGQVQGGQNALVALSQQAADIGIVLGAPLIGVIASLAAVVAASSPQVQEFVSGLLKAKDNAKKLEEGLKALQERIKINADGTVEYTQRIKDLAKVSKAAAEVELSIALIQAEANIATATAGIVDSVSEIEESFKRVEGSRSRIGRIQGLKRLREELGLTAEQAKQFRAASQTLIAAPTIENAAAFNELAKTFDLNNEKFRGFIVELNSYVQALNNGKVAADSLKDILVDFDISAVSGATGAGAASSQSGVDEFKKRQELALTAFNALQNSLLTEEEAIKASYKKRRDVIFEALATQTVGIKEAAKAQADITAEKNAALDALDAARVSSAESFISQSLGIIQAGLDKESGLAKAAFAANQAIAFANVLVNTEDHAKSVAASIGGIGGIVAENAVRAAGYASAGVIAGTTIASFEGGGMTPSGPRSGGMDGKGGMLAMLHPNEKVTDLTKGGGDSKVENKIQIINNSSNVRVSQPTLKDQVTRIVIEDINRDGEISSFGQQRLGWSRQRV